MFRDSIYLSEGAAAHNRKLEHGPGYGTPAQPKMTAGRPSGPLLSAWLALAVGMAFGAAVASAQRVEVAAGL